LSAALEIKAAQPQDVPLILSLIAELAEYERAPDSAIGREEQLSRALFGTPPHAEAVIASVDGEPAGFALFFGTFSTWLCLPGLLLEDLYVRPPFRGGGVGYALLTHVASIAVDRGCGRLEWVVLDWNAPAISFYHRLGAEKMEEWDIMRLSAEALAAVASNASA
jgi:GNAT superfamily N-acetyltransferase